MSPLLVADPRPSWQDWAFLIAFAVAKRADCSRRQVGAVLLSADNRVLATGYNGTPLPGSPGCLSGACPRAASDVPPGSSYDTGPGACIAVHAELNALLTSAPHERQGAWMAVTDEPCAGCTRLIAASGITRVVWPGGGQGLVFA